jgi:Leucine-rich repeat (LRR) protein
MAERVDTNSFKFQNLKQLKYVDLSYINIGHMPNIVLDEAMNLTFLDLSGIDLRVVSGQHAQMTGRQKLHIRICYWYVRIIK